jgi:tetratricopeptide (TPR) repeat protein
MKECQDEMKQRTELKHQLSSNAGAGASGSTTAPTKLLRPMSDRIVWVLLSSALLEVGYLKDAKLLLELALEQANVFDDDECRSRCLHLLARVAFWEENVANAIKLELEAQEYDGDLDLWCDSIAAVVDYTEYSGDQRSCKRCLDQAIESLHQIAAARASSAAMAKFYRARFMHRKAKVLAGIKASPGSAFGTPVLNAPPGDCDAAVALLRETISEIDLCGVDIAVVDMHRDLVYLLRRKAHGEAETSAINAQSVFEECTASLEAAAKVVKHVLLTSSSAVSDSFRVVQKRTLAALYLARSEIDLDLAYLQQHVLAERESAKVIEFNRTEHGDTEMMTRWMKEQDHLTQVEPLPAGGMAHDAASILHLQAALNLDSGAATEARVSLGMGKALRFQAKEQQDFKSAIETLNRCVQQAREQHEDILVADASAEILQCYLTMHSSPHMPAVERADRPEMLWSLSAFQGCTASQQLRQRYVWASPLSSPEIFALRLRDELAARLQPPSRALSERLATIEGFLDKSEAFNTLRSATAASLDETRELLPDKMKVIILQHTKDGRQLFCGSLSKDTISSEPPEPSVDADGEEDDTQLPVCAIDVDPRALADLQEESSKFSKAASTYIASIGKASTQPSAELGTRNPRFNSAEEVAVGWRTHCQHLANYLQPALDAVVPANFVGEGEQLVLLLDDSLMTLPVDAMASFATAESVARDFSLALFTYRLRAAASVGSGTALIGKADVAYVVDPLDEGYAANVDVKKEWTGVVGSDHVPSIAEYKQLLHGSSAFLYFGAGSTQAVVDPAALATTPISAHAVLLFDRHLTELASRMQAERDRRTTALEKWLDTPLMTVSLLSVQGAKSVVCNLRTTRLECNAAMAREVLIGLEGSKSLGHALCQARKEWVTATQPIDGEEVQTGNIAQALEGHAAYNTIVVGLPHISM